MTRPIECTCSSTQRERREARKDCAWHRQFPYVRDPPPMPEVPQPVPDRDVWKLLQEYTEAVNKLHESVLRVEKKIDAMERRQADAAYGVGVFK